MPSPKRQLDVVFQPIMRSASMRQVDKVIRTVGGKDVTVTFTGESGTGKEVLARRLHEISHRHAAPFVPINCAAIPETLFESELFGHEKGAFTGASERAKGKIEAAEGGTLFLDEIGEMPLAVQAKLLRFLENRRFMRVGGATKISVDVRLVTATLRPLEEDVRAGRFRADLFYRIEGMTIPVPPLRERGPDIAPLAQQFLAEVSARHDIRPPRLTRAAVAALHAYAWPGNVRELRNTIEYVCLMRQGRRVAVRDLPEKVRRAVAERLAAPAIQSRQRSRRQSMEVRLDTPLTQTLDSIMAAALALEDGNRSRAAKRLGIGLRTMQRFAARAGHERAKTGKPRSRDRG
jgi:transcriptional regulator with PAS, ATPase and Fis domain